VTRLIRKYRPGGVVAAKAYRWRRFPSKYTRRHIELLAEVGRAHGWFSGPATVRILKREREQFGKAEYARLAKISVGASVQLTAEHTRPKSGRRVEVDTAQRDQHR